MIRNDTISIGVKMEVNIGIVWADLPFRATKTRVREDYWVMEDY